MTVLYIVLAVALTTVVLWAYFTAQRLNRMHIRLDAALSNLQGALDTRAAVVAACFPQLASVAEEASLVPLDPRDVSARVEREKNLVAKLHTELEGVGRSEVPQVVADAHIRVQLTHRFYNDAVVDTRALRARPLVRAFRLGGRAPMPSYVELPVATPLWKKVP